MLRLLSTIVGQPVVSQQDAGPVTVIREAVAEPGRAKIIAYRVEAAPGLLATADILAYLDDGVAVADRDAFQSLDDLVRVKRLGDGRTKLLGLRVVTEQGRRVGTVSDVLIETEGHFVARLHVRARFPRRLLGGERIIPRERIIRMTADEVVVRYDSEARPVGAEPEIAQ